MATLIYTRACWPVSPAPLGWRALSQGTRSSVGYPVVGSPTTQSRGPRLLLYRDQPVPSTTSEGWRPGCLMMMGEEASRGHTLQLRRSPRSSVQRARRETASRERGLPK